MKPRNEKRAAVAQSGKRGPWKVDEASSLVLVETRQDASSTLKRRVKDNAPYLAFYGDDFTGSTDALEFLTRAGLRTRLFLTPPSPAQVAGLDAVGVAGFTRALAPAAMERELRASFAALRALRPRHVHYKVCSTFDSSPRVGSIGRAIDVGAEIFPQRFVPLLVGAPALGRYCVFGNLFARMGIGSTGEIHRLDRHPSISRHPVTPMTEADLQRHLARQTRKRIALLDVLALERPERETRAKLDALARAGAEIVLFDALRPEHVARIGALLAALASRTRPLFSIGSSAVEMALGAVAPTRSLSLRSARAARPLLVVSGSCSPVTASQIDWAEANGFAAFPFDDRASRRAAESLRRGRHTIVYSHRGRRAREPIAAAELGGALGWLARDLAARHGVRRMVVAGGDTSSYAARALGLESLEMLAPLAPGAPLCRARAPSSPVDGIEINFKGGQVGAADYFGAVARGKL